MLPIVLVLLVAASALAAPGAQLNIVSINEAIPPKHNGRLVSAYLLDQATEIEDGGEMPAYVLTPKAISEDLANHSDKRSQALGLAESIAILGAHSTGIPGDACAAAQVIDAYVRAIRSGNKAGVRSAVAKFIQSVSIIIDQIVQLSINPSALRFATGSRGNCIGEGRTYQFEAAWDSILSSASPSSARLLNEQYCAAKRLYNAFTSRNNNAGAFITAVSLPAVQDVFLAAFEPVARCMSAVAAGNPGPACAAANRALARAAQH